MVGESLVQVPVLQVHESAIVVGIGVTGVDRDRPVEIGEGRDQISLPS